jgi:hypothetical protein
MLHAEETFIMKIQPLFPGLYVTLVMCKVVLFYGVPKS